MRPAYFGVSVLLGDSLVVFSDHKAFYSSYFCEKKPVLLMRSRDKVSTVVMGSSIL